MTDRINVLSLVKETERYLFLYDDARWSETLAVVGRFAADPDLSLSWEDAAVLSQRLVLERERREDPSLPI